LATQSAITTVLAAIAEAASGADAQTGSRLYFVTVNEAATGAATQTATIVATASVAELATALSTLTVVRTANVYPNGIQLLVSIGNVLVWAVIDDSQNPNWQNINSAQNPGWNNLPS
jgi:hypothetical protein